MDMRRRRRICPLHRMLAFTSLIGIMNILLLYNNMREPLEIYSQPKSFIKIHRQISSVGSQSEDVAGAKPKQNVLEQLNLILKEAVDRYQFAESEIAPHYERALQDSSRDVFLDQEFSADVEINRVHKSRCDKEPFLLILVHSRLTNYIDRQSIRLSWGKEENTINQWSWTRPENSWKTIFVVGRSINSSLNALIHNEARAYGDVVVGNFLDTYRNLTLKLLHGLKWANTSCRPKYILKTDDDCYVNTYSLIEWLKDYHRNNGWRPLYAGRVQSGMQVVRNKSSRHFISEKEHPSPTFVRYVSGGGYLFSASLLPRILATARKMVRIPVEDAAFGRYMNRIGVKPTNNEKFLPFIFCQRPSKGYFDVRVSICYFQKPLVVHGMRDIDHIRMHYNVLLMTFIPTLCNSSVGEEMFKKKPSKRCFKFNEPKGKISNN